MDTGTLKEAHAAAKRYSVMVRPHERLGFLARCVEMPGVLVDGRTEMACLRAMREALTVAVAAMMADGEAPPAPLSENRRETQVNVRLTAEEKVMLEEAAKQRGYKGLSDFVRAAALAKTIAAA